MRTSGIFGLLMTCFTLAQAQQRNYWSPHTGPAERIVKAKAVNRITFPASFQLFDLNLQTLQPDLMAAVHNKAPIQLASTVISLPNADGNLEEFEVYECSNFEPDLQARFRDIRAFSGRGLTDKKATLKLSLSPNGIQTLVFRADAETEFIEPYSQDHRVYAVFRRKRVGRQIPWNCSTVEKNFVSGLNNQVISLAAVTPISGEFRTLRLAQSCNGEYANYFKATTPSDVAKVMTAFNNTLTRCNGIYERDLALHLNLIDKTTDVIYYDPKSDPYSPNLSTWNSQLQKTLTNLIGEANYDIGHLFGATGGGGNAGCIGCVCVDGSKGSGITSPADGIPEGDNFDIDYVIHEVGHQLGANHTFSMSNEGRGQNKEVGSGITIMGYAGITSQDVARHSIDIFHATSIEQILGNLSTKSCPQKISISKTNSAPVISDIGPFTIPISTPFALTDTATDANNDPLTYCWEQNDNATSSQTGSSSVAAPNKNPGPNWISFPPTSSPTRYFPKLSTILAGGLVSGPLPGGDAGANTEALSSVSRTLNFRLTVRDNHTLSLNNAVDTSVGQIAFTDVVINVSNSAGPFSISSQNTDTNWTIGSSPVIRWNVASTDNETINCKKVKILLSTDSGQTFPLVLADSTLNDGTETVILPNSLTPTNKARIKVQALRNIFFDINNANISLIYPVSCSAPVGLTSSNLDTSKATVKWRKVSSAVNYLLNYKLTTETTWTSLPTSDSSADLTNLKAASVYDWRVKVNCGSGDSSTFSAAQFTTLSPSCRSAYDTSSNNTTSGAKTIPLNTDIKGLISPSGDVDYFMFSTNATGTLTLSLSTLPANYNLKLLNSSGTQLLLSQNNGTANETITYQVTSASSTDYFAQVFGKGNANNASSCYTLRITLPSGAKIGQKSDAGFTGINESSPTLAPGIIKIFPNPVNSMLQLYGRGWTSPVEVEVYQMNGIKALRQRLQPGWQTIDVSRLASGLYLLRIKTPSGEMQEYKFLKQ